MFVSASKIESLKFTLYVNIFISSSFNIDECKLVVACRRTVVFIIRCVIQKNMHILPLETQNPVESFDHIWQTRE